MLLAKNIFFKMKEFKGKSLKSEQRFPMKIFVLKTSVISWKFCAAHPQVENPFENIEI